jgi:ribonuclease P protein subunit RPR2
LRRGIKSKRIVKIALERLEILFKMAEDEFHLHPERSNRYVVMARNIAQKYNLEMPPYWRGRYCRKCNRFLKPGLNSQVRLSKATVITKCIECGALNKKAYNREQKVRRRNKLESHTPQEGIDA